MCLGHEDAADLRTPLRASEGNGLLNAAIREAITRKPKAMISSLTGPIVSRL
jgi:GTP 3',8-cyclase